MATDWFRQEEWNEDIEQEFLAKLARARTQRDQYLVIQALTISMSAPTVALRLVALYFDTKKDSFEDLRALSAKSDAYLALGNTELAIDAMKCILAIERARPNHKTTKYVDYPFLVATQHISSEFHDALHRLLSGVASKYASDGLGSHSVVDWTSRNLIGRCLQIPSATRKH